MKKHSDWDKYVSSGNTGGLEEINYKKEGCSSYLDSIFVDLRAIFKFYSKKWDFPINVKFDAKDRRGRDFNMKKNLL